MEDQHCEGGVVLQQCEWQSLGSLLAGMTSHEVGSQTSTAGAAQKEGPRSRPLGMPWLHEELGLPIHALQRQTELDQGVMSGKMRRGWQGRRVDSPCRPWYFSGAAGPGCLLTNPHQPNEAAQGPHHD